MKRILVVLFLLCAMLRAAEPRVLFLGDSITYDGRWTTLVESALRATPAFESAEIVNMGLPSETVSGLSEEGHAGGKFPRPDLHERLGRVLEGYKPTLVIACYGMNDGIYLPPDPARKADGMWQERFPTENGSTKLVSLWLQPEGRATLETVTLERPKAR